MRKLLVLFCFLPGTVAFAKNEPVDSLKKALFNAREDTSKVQLLNALSWQLKMAVN